jgi:hypothetical protein
MNEPWLTKRELAAALKTSTRTIERLDPPAMRVGGQNRHKLSEVEAFMAGEAGRLGDVVELRPVTAAAGDGMSAFRRGDKWVSKLQHRGKQLWTPGGPWPTKSAAQAAEQRYRDRLNARRTQESCASFADCWLREWPRPESSTQRLYAAAARRFAEHFGPTLLSEVEGLSARAWALTVPRSVSRVIGTMYEDARNIGLVEANPFSNLRLPVTEKPEVNAPTMDGYRALVEACTTLGGYGTEFRGMV